jgi:2,4-dichlorophenol 6-monooxygenase
VRTVTTDVLVVGAGPAGLTTTAVLAQSGIKTITLSRYTGTAQEPRATIMNQRTTEVLRDIGVEQEIAKVGVPLREQSNCVFATSLAGEEILRYEAYGVGERTSDYLMASPCSNYNAGQHLVEPILVDRATALDADIRFAHEMVTITQSPEGVAALVRDRQTGEDYEIRARYAIGADGGRSRVAEQLGITFTGESALIHMVNAWFTADLAEHAAYRPGHIYAIMQPGGDSWVGSGSFIAVRRWDEWVLSRQYDGSQGEPDRSDDAVIAAVRLLVGDPDLKVTVHGTSIWQVNQQVANEYRKGRVFLAGDAAHRHPPAGGLGSNTSIQDAFNLAWKLAMVIRGEAGPGLLDSYHQERRPVGAHMVARTMQNLGYMAEMSKALGLAQRQTGDAGWAALNELAADTPEGALRRARVAEATELQHYRSSAHGTDLGQRYESCAVVGDGTLFPAASRDPELFYEPTTHPGAYLPHAWVERKRQRVSTLDLAGHGRFCLIVGVGGAPWVQAAVEVAGELGIDLPVYAVGYRCEYDDVLSDWSRVREVDDRGALLVRPDRHIAWRSLTAVESPREALASALRTILDRTTNR